MKLQTKLGLVFASVATGAIVVAILISNWSVHRSFTEYVHQRHQVFYMQVANGLIAEYQRNGSISLSSLSFYGHQAMMEGYRLRWEKPPGETMWESPDPSHLLPPNNEERTWSSHSFILQSGGENLGTLVFMYPREELILSDPDITFVGHLNKNFWIATLLATLLSFLASMVVSRYLTDPLIQMRHVAMEIQEGSLTSRVHVDRQDEIGELGQSINHLAESLQHQESMRKTLTADVAHELRTPVATLQGYLEAFNDGLWQPTPELLGACYQETLRMKNLIADLESLASAEVGLSYNMERLDLSQLTLTVTEALRPKAEEKGLTVEHTIEPSVYVYGDRNRLSQMLVNLIENAIKYNLPNGEIRIQLEENRPDIIVSVSDTGKGIAGEDIPYIFERFYRGDKSRTRLTGGSGIGLALVKAVALAHNGNAAVASTSDQGTTMQVILPSSL